MASLRSNPCSYSFSIPKTTLTTPQSPAFLHPPPYSCGYWGISVQKAPFDLRTFAKFEKFDGPSPQDNLEGNPETESFTQQQTVQVEEREEDDSCLPSDLEGAVRQTVK